MSASIWIVGSTDNDPAISSLWLSKTGNITKFDNQDLDTLLSTIDEHHPDWRELEVHGLAREHAELALEPYRGSYSGHGTDAFVFKKTD